MTTQKQADTPKQETLKVPCEVYSRIVGYLRPVRNWNDGKRQEFVDRTTFKTEQDNAPAAE
jgi:ribonucleoside-triphosphate reductase